MEKQIDLLNSQMKNLAEEKLSNEKNLNDLTVEMEKIRQQYQQLWDELNMMRIENVVEPEIFGGILAKSQSETKIPTKVDETVGEIRTKAGMILEEVVSLEKKFRAAKYQKQNFAVDLDEIRGELEINRAEKKLENDKLVTFIESLTGEAFPYENFEKNFVSDLRENLEIKKLELAELSRKYEEDCRNFREQLQAATQFGDQKERIEELQRRIYKKDEEINQLKAKERAKLIESTAFGTAPGTHGAPGTRAVDSHGTQADDPSEIFLRNQLQQYKEDLRRIGAEIQTKSANFEQNLDDLRRKLHLTSNLLNEKENCVKILEHEIKSLENLNQHEQSQRAQEKAHYEALVLHLQQEKSALRDQLTAEVFAHGGAEFSASGAGAGSGGAAAESGGAAAGSGAAGTAAESDVQNISSIENLWKKEIEMTTKKYENHVDLLMRDMQAQKSAFQAKVQDLQEMLRCTKSMIEDKENCISLLEKELKSFEVARKNSEIQTKSQIDEFNERIEILTIERDHLRQSQAKFKAGQEPKSPETKKSQNFTQLLQNFPQNLPSLPSLPHLPENFPHLPDMSCLKSPLKQRKSVPGDLTDAGMNTELYGVEIDQHTVISDYEARIAQIYGELRSVQEENERLKEIQDLANFAQFYEPALAAAEAAEIEPEFGDGEEKQPEIHKRISTAPIVQRYEQRILELQRKLEKFELEPAFGEENARLQNKMSTADEENARLQQELAKGDEENARLQQELAKGEEENARLQKELAMAAEEVEATRIHYVELNEGLQQEISSLQIKISQIASRFLLFHLRLNF